MIGASEMMNAISVTEKIPAPIHIKIRGAMATIGTVCSNNVQGYNILRTQRDCANSSATPTPTTTLNSIPPMASSAVMANESSSDGKRAATALATAHGEGNMYGGTRKIHRMSCQISSSAAKTPNAFAATV